MLLSREPYATDFIEFFFLFSFFFTKNIIYIFF